MANDELIIGGILLLAVLAMAAGGDGDSEPITLTFGDPPDPDVQMLTSRPNRPHPDWHSIPYKPPQKFVSPGPKDDFNKQPAKAVLVDPQVARTQAIEERIGRLQAQYSALERRTQEIWLRITQDELKQHILHPGTVATVQELLHSIDEFTENVKKTAKEFSIDESSLAGGAILTALENIRAVYGKLNALLAASERSKQDANTAALVDELEALQDTLVSRLGLERMEYEFGRREELSNNPANDFNQYAGYGPYEEEEGEQRLTTDNTGGNKRHQSDNTNTFYTWGTAGNALDPMQDVKTNRDAHSIAQPSSVTHTTNTVSDSNINTTHPLENTESGKKGGHKGVKLTNQPRMAQLSKEIRQNFSTDQNLTHFILEHLMVTGQKVTDLSSDDIAQMKLQMETGQTGKKRGADESQDLIDLVSKKQAEGDDDLETDRTTFVKTEEANQANEPKNVKDGFNSAGQHHQSALNPVVDQDWSFHYEPFQPDPKFAPLKRWMTEQLKKTTVNVEAYKKVEARGVDTEKVRAEQQIIQLHQQRIAAIFSGKTNAIRAIINPLSPDFEEGEAR